jgi:hypothetical protein
MADSEIVEPSSVAVRLNEWLRGGNDDAKNNGCQS